MAQGDIGDGTPLPEMVVDGPGPNNGSEFRESLGEPLLTDVDVVEDEDTASLLTTSAGLGLQTKLTVNTPGDQFEQEADRVADQVMRMPEPQVQRQCACGKSSTEGECSECKKRKQEATGSLQRVASSPVGEIAAPRIVDSVLSSPGSPLPAATRSFMESRFGQDFSHVRVHTDLQAAESSAAVQARAYTVGNNIAFAQGEFEPNSTSGRNLLAHELTHVLQQGGRDGIVKPTLQRQVQTTIVRKVGQKALKWLASKGKNVSAHIAKRHVANRLGKTAFKAGGKDVQKLLTRVLKNADRMTPQGRRVVFEKVFEREVGQGGETVIRVVVDRVTGKIITAFPTRAMLSLGASAVGVASSSAAKADQEIKSRRDAFDAAHKPSLIEQAIDFIVDPSPIARDEDIGAEERIIDQHVDEAIVAIEAEMQKSLSMDERAEVREVIHTEMSLTPGHEESE